MFIGKDPFERVAHEAYILRASESPLEKMVGRLALLPPYNWSRIVGGWYTIQQWIPYVDRRGMSLAPASHTLKRDMLIGKHGFDVYAVATADEVDNSFTVKLSYTSSGLLRNSLTVEHAMPDQDVDASLHLEQFLLEAEQGLLTPNPD